MAHRRVKDIAYDDDDLEDDYEEGFEDDSQAMSAEDQQQMRTGTTAVREGLGEDSDFTTDKEIQDALWYYFYDVEKSVAYLRKQKRPEEQAQTPQKKQKQASKFEQAAQKAEEIVTPANGNCWSPLWSSATTIPVDFFSDTPFLSVPSHRLGVLTPPYRPRLPKDGLLGGSGNSQPGASKPSKLAALAASRKKAAEEKRKAGSGSADSSNDPDKSSVGALDRLGKRQKVGVERGQAGIECTRSGVEGLNIGGSAEDGSRKDDHARMRDVSEENDKPAVTWKRGYPRKERPPSAVEEVPNETTDASSALIDEPSAGSEEPEEDLQAAPSSFANSLFKTTPGKSSGHARSAPRPFTLPLPDTQVPGGTEDPFSGPSPDDIVTKAQNQGKGSKSSKANSTKKSSEKEATNGVKNLKLDDSGSSTPTSTSSKVKSKNIDVAAEYAKMDHRRFASFVVIGHVDHGKSTLMGRILHDTAQINTRDFSKLSASATSAGKGSFNYAWLMDSTAEERARGVTVDIAHTSFSVPADLLTNTPATDFNILDAPGHKDFVPNMIAGAAQADFAVLVVDASTGEFEKGLEGGGQTKEHALLVRSLGVQNVIVAVNKMDQIGWRQSRFEEVSGQVYAFLGKIGYRASDVRVIPCAGLTGENVVARSPPTLSTSKKEKLPEDRFGWYTGATLLTALTDFTPQTHNLTKPFRLTIGDIFRSSVQNPLSISGRIDAGTVQVGDTLLCMPAAESCVVRGVEVASSAGEDGDVVDYAVAGQLATLHLTDIDAFHHLRAGDLLCPPSAPVQNITTFTAKVLAFEHLMPGPLDCHRGRMHCSATVTKLLGIVGQEGKKKPRVVKPGQVVSVRVELERAMPLEGAERVVLRSEGSTVAAGKVDGVGG